MQRSLNDIIIEKYGSQSNCAKAIGWTRQRLNKIINKQREARVSEINILAAALGISVSMVINFLS